MNDQQQKWIVQTFFLINFAFYLSSEQLVDTNLQLVAINSQKQLTTRNSYFSISQTHYNNFILRQQNFPH